MVGSGAFTSASRRGARAPSLATKAEMAAARGDCVDAVLDGAKPPGWIGEWVGAPDGAKNEALGAEGCTRVVGDGRGVL